MAQSLITFTNAVVTAMVANSQYPILAGQPMPTAMEDAMIDSMERLATPIYTMVESFLFEPSTLEPTYQVKTNLNDPLPGYLGAKIDDDTIKYNLSTYKLYVNAVPVATAIKRGGVQIGAQPFLYMQGSNLMLNAETSALLVGGNNMVPTSRAVKLYVDAALIALGSGGGGDMYKLTYDTNDDGVVDDSERLGTQLPAYYLAWANITGKQTTLAGYGITDAYTMTALDAFFEGEASGKKQVDWARITSKPNLYTIQNQGVDRVLTANATGYDIQAEANLLFNGSLLTVTGDVDITDVLTVDILTEYTLGLGVDIEGVRHQDWRTAYTETTEPSSVAANEIEIYAEEGTWGAETNSILKYKDETGNVARLTHRRFVHSEPTPVATWTINHNMGEEPNIDVYDNASPPNKVIAPVKHASVYQAVIEMPMTLSGKAVCII